MNKQYHDYLQGMHLQLEVQKQDETRNATALLFNQLISLAENNKENLQIFKGVDSELSTVLENAVDDPSQLPSLVQLANEGVNSLGSVKHSIDELLAMPVVYSNAAFQRKADEIAHHAYNTMDSATIRSVHKSIQDFIQEMEDIINAELHAKKQRRQKIIKYVLRGGGIVLGLYLLITFIIPFIMQWWFVILLMIIGIVFLIRRSR